MRVVVVALLAAVACGGSKPAAESGDDLDVEPRDARRHVAKHNASLASGGGPRQAAIAGSRTSTTSQEVIDVDFVNVDLHNAFRFLADVGKVNIVVSDDVKGSISLRLSRVSWLRVVESIAKLKGLRVERDGGIYRVSVARGARRKARGAQR